MIGGFGTVCGECCVVEWASGGVDVGSLSGSRAGACCSVLSWFSGRWVGIDGSTRGW